MTRLGDKCFLHALQRRVAGLVIGGSTLRNMTGPRGVDVARQFCVNGDVLGRARRTQDFGVELDALTSELTKALPVHTSWPDRSLWGPARKLLNLFLYESTFNHYLREQFELEFIEQKLEVPLDSFVARGILCDIHKYALQFGLGRWCGVVHVTSEINSSYQAAALRIAEVRQLRCRAHLDLIYWRQDPPAGGCECHHHQG